MSINDSNRWQEREDAIVRSILSGNNACGTLDKALQTGALEDFLRGMIRPTLHVCAAEYGEMVKERNELSADNEAKRFALEFVVSNLGGAVTISEPAVLNAIRKALPGREV